jgi:hypothetical protein
MTISFARHQFPPEIIRHAVWLYVRFTLSYRDVEDLLAERGLDVLYLCGEEFEEAVGGARAGRGDKGGGVSADEGAGWFITVPAPVDRVSERDRADREPIGSQRFPSRTTQAH